MTEGECNLESIRESTREEARRVYRAASCGPAQWPVGEIAPTREFCAELGRLAAADGACLNIACDEFSMYVWFGPPSRYSITDQPQLQLFE